MVLKNIVWVAHRIFSFPFRSFAQLLEPVDVE